MANVRGAQQPQQGIRRPAKEGDGQNDNDQGCGDNGGPRVGAGVEEKAGAVRGVRRGARLGHQMACRVYDARAGMLLLFPDVRKDVRWKMQGKRKGNGAAQAREPHDALHLQGNFDGGRPIEPARQRKNVEQPAQKAHDQPGE